MRQRYDVSLKTLFLGEGDGIIRRRLFGGRVVEYLNTEQPEVSNRQADMVVRTEDDTLHHVEFQAGNEDGFPLRMLTYYAYLVRQHRRHVSQVVLYLGREPLRMEDRFTSPTLDFRFEIINLREIDAEPLLTSDDWADNALALLAKGEPERALAAIIPRIAAMDHPRRDVAAATLVFLSGILKLEEKVSAGTKEIGMIDVMENAILGPMLRQKYAEGLEQGIEKGIEQGIEKGIEKGIERGIEKGVLEGRQTALRQIAIEILASKFGELPSWARDRLAAATSEEVHFYALRAINAKTLEETLG